jgi:Zn-dependent oligopeptidase
MPAKQRHIKIAGKPWRLVYRSLKQRHLCGLCDYNTRTITVCTSLADVDELDTLCHELLHACQGFASEDHVAEVATTLATVLWQIGYRKEANDGR